MVPWIVLAISAFIALRMPPGRDLGVPVFWVPWNALEVNLGADVLVAQAILMVLALKYAAEMRLSPGKIPSIGLIAAIIVLGLAAATITFNTHSVDIEFAGGALRNGPLRTLVVLVVFLLAIIPFALINARGARFSIIGLLRVYVISVLVLCTLGILQYVVYQATGNDIFPIGLLGGNPEHFRTGKFVAFGGPVMRPSSFGGEPKGLSMATAAAAVLIMAFGSRLFRSRAKLYGAFFLCLSIIYLTQSTSGFVAFGLGVVVFFGLRSLGRPLARSTILVAYLIGTAAITSVYFYNVENVTLLEHNSYATKKLRQSDSIMEVLYLRTLGRMDVEDMDWVIIKSFQEDPAGLIIGRGFGLGHLFTDPFIPLKLDYMIGTLNSPKSGITLFLVNGGVISLVLFIFFLARVTPAAEDALRSPDPAYRDYIRRAQIAFITLVVMLMLRTYVYELGLMLMAIMSSALCYRAQGRQRPGSVAGQRQHRQFGAIEPHSTIAGSAGSVDTAKGDEGHS